MSGFSLMLTVHVACGVLALATFWIPLVVAKGGRAHRRAGWAYVGAMLGVAVTAVLLAMWRLFLDPEPSSAKTSFAYFLIMISIFAVSAVWSGVRSLRFKARVASHRGMAELAWPLARIVSALAIMVYGFRHEDALLSWFPLVAVGTGAGDLHYWLTAPRERMHWWFSHMSNMFTACIATITAFVVTAGPRLFGPQGRSLLLWLSPSIVLVPLLIAMTRHYRRRFQH